MGSLSGCQAGESGDSNRPLEKGVVDGVCGGSSESLNLIASGMPAFLDLVGSCLFAFASAFDLVGDCSCSFLSCFCIRVFLAGEEMTESLTSWEMFVFVALSW